MKYNICSTSCLTTNHQQSWMSFVNLFPQMLRQLKSPLQPPRRRKEAKKKFMRSVCKIPLRINCFHLMLMTRYFPEVVLAPGPGEAQHCTFLLLHTWLNDKWRHLYSGFNQNAFAAHSTIHAHTHTDGNELPRRVLARPSGAVWDSVSCPRTLCHWTANPVISGRPTSWATATLLIGWTRCVQPIRCGQRKQSWKICSAGALQDHKWTLKKAQL